jgi:mannose-6-phosphate isomerase-like protein (cupin superfamily)
MHIKKKAATAAIYAGTSIIILSCAVGCDSTESKQTKKTTSNMEEAKGYSIDIEKATIENKDFRKVLYTSKHMQLVLMTLKPNEEIGEEVHEENDQFFRFESGNGLCTINGNLYRIKSGDVIIVPAGAKHNVINSDSSLEMKLYAIYSPPNHKDGIIRATKKEAETNGVKYDGQTTE